jgi:uncharacterized protein YhbP (UPF0306 family)
MNFIACSSLLTNAYDFIFIFCITCFFFILFDFCKFNISIFLEKKTQHWNMDSNHANV